MSINALAFAATAHPAVPTGLQHGTGKTHTSHEAGRLNSQDKTCIESNSPLKTEWVRSRAGNGQGPDDVILSPFLGADTICIEILYGL